MVCGWEPCRRVMDEWEWVDGPSGGDPGRHPGPGAAPLGAAGGRWPGDLPAAGAGQRARRDEPRPGGPAGRDGPADPARLGGPLQPGGRRRPAGSSTLRPAFVPRPRSAGGAEDHGAAWARPEARRPQQLDRQGPVPPGRAALRRELQRERHAGPAARARAVLAEDAAHSPPGRPPGAGTI